MESKLSKKGLVFPLQLAAQTHLVERTGWLEVTPGQVVVLVPFTTHRSGNLKICHVPNSFNNLKHTHTHTLSEHLTWNRPLRQHEPTPAIFPADAVVEL